VLLLLLPLLLLGGLNRLDGLGRPCSSLLPSRWGCLDLLLLIDLLTLRLFAAGLEWPGRLAPRLLHLS